MDDRDAMFLGLGPLEDPVNGVKGHPTDPVDGPSVRHVVVPEASDEHRAAGSGGQVRWRHHDLAEEQALELGVGRNPECLPKDIFVVGLPGNKIAEPVGGPIHTGFPVQKDQQVLIADAFTFGSQLGLEVGKKGFGGVFVVGGIICHGGGSMNSVRCLYSTALLRICGTVIDSFVLVQLLISDSGSFFELFGI